jgi:hypothetical protein
MFAEPQPVEVHHRGTWYSGELLGWRFGEAGRCQLRVRCVVDGLRHSAWVELPDARLPERAAPPTTPAAPPAAAALAVRHAVLPRSPAGPPAPPDRRRTDVEHPAAPPVQWATIRRHEAAAPAWPAPVPHGRQRLQDDDTQPHALLIDRHRRPPVPRPAPSAGSARQPFRVDAG